MLRKILTWVGWIATLLVVVVLSYAGYVYVRSEQILQTKYPAPKSSITIPTDAVSIARGEHLSRAVTSCVLCHGEDLGGRVYVNMCASLRMAAIDQVGFRRNLIPQLRSEL